MPFTFQPLASLQVCELTFPACWASALVNNDYSGLDETESEACRAQVADMAAMGWSVVSVASDESGEAREPHFTRCFDLNGGTAQCGDVLEYIAHKI
jgi:hypothetical protein